MTLFWPILDPPPLECHVLFEWPPDINDIEVTSLQGQSLFLSLQLDLWKGLNGKRGNARLNVTKK